jgi:NADH dehydrogenase FAD-containing subunit
LRAMEKNTEMKEYKSKKRLMVISLGKYNGIIEYKNFVMYGFFPALVKWGIERYFMKAYKSKD